MPSVLSLDHTASHYLGELPASSWDRHALPSTCLRKPPYSQYSQPANSFPLISPVVQEVKVVLSEPLVGKVIFKSRKAEL